MDGCEGLEGLISVGRGGGNAAGFWQRKKEGNAGILSLLGALSEWQKASRGVLRGLVYSGAGAGCMPGVVGVVLGQILLSSLRSAGACEGHWSLVLV